MYIPLLSTVMTDFGRSLLILLQGMGGVFFFMGLFYLLIMALEKLFAPKKES